MDISSSTRAAENRTRWKGIVAKSSVLPRPTNFQGYRIEQNKIYLFVVFFWFKLLITKMIPFVISELL